MCSDYLAGLAMGEEEQHVLCGDLNLCLLNAAETALRSAYRAEHSADIVAGLTIYARLQEAAGDTLEAGRTREELATWKEKRKKGAPPRERP